MIQKVIEQLSPLGWNQRQFCEIEFFDLCTQSGVYVWFDRIDVPGRYFYYRSHPIIALHPDLSGFTRLWVYYHELAHHFLHVPKDDFHYTEFAYLLETKEDLEADAVATPMVIPKSWLKEPGLFELWEQGYPPSLLERRKTIWDRFKF